MSHIVPEYQQRKAEKPQFEWPLSTLKEVLTSILGNVKAGSICLLIDAFDECKVSSKSSLLKFVREDLIQHPSFPQIFITSRLDPAFEHEMAGYPTIRLNDINNKDIETYVQIEFQSVFWLQVRISCGS